MSDVFPVLCLSQELLSSLSCSDFPNSRLRALRRALKERCLVKFSNSGQASVPDGERIIKNRDLRVLDSNCPIKGEVLDDIDRWEESCLGKSFASCVVKQGSSVREALKPGLMANRALWVIDPHLFSLDKNGRLHAKGLELLLNGASTIQVFKAIVKLRHSTELEKHNLKESDFCQRVSEWLKAKLQHLSSAEISLIDASADVHDRFLGLSTAVERADFWHAVSIGYGMTGLTDKKQNLVCVARITSEHFIDAWEIATKRSKWQVHVGQELVQSKSGWEEFPIEKAAIPQVSILQRVETRGGRVGSMRG